MKHMTGRRLAWFILLLVQTASWAQTRPLTLDNLKSLAKDGDVTENRLEQLVSERGIAFIPSPQAIRDLRESGVPEAVLTIVSGQIPAEQSRDYYLQTGDRLMADGRYDDAIAYYQKVLQQSAGDSEAKTRIARAQEAPKTGGYRYMLRAALQTPDCAAAFSYAQKILFVTPGDKEAMDANRQCAYQRFRMERTLSQPAADDAVFSPDSRWLASGGMDVGLWDVGTGRQVRIFRGFRNVAFSPDGRILATGNAANGTVTLWNAANGQRLRTVEGHPLGVSAVVFSPAGNLFASAGGFTVRIWETATGQQVHAFNLPRTGVRSLAFSPDGSRLGCAGTGTVHVWDVRTGRQLYQFDAVGPIAFSPNGRWLASGGPDKTVKIRDAAYGSELHTLRGHTSVVTSLAFSPDSRWLASAGDLTVKIWDATTGQELRTLKGGVGFVSSVAFSPDGHWLAYTGRNAIELWRND